MDRQIKNIANAYLLIMGLVLILLMLITIRLVDVYYNDEAKEILETRIDQLESIYTNYYAAGIKLEGLNNEYIDQGLVSRLDGISDMLAQSPLLGSDVSEEIYSFFGGVGQHKIDSVTMDEYIDFMRLTYNLEVERPDSGLSFKSFTLEGQPWRMAVKFDGDSGKVIIVSENVSEARGLEDAFKNDIKGRIEKHLMREPMAVSAMLVDENEELVFCSEHPKGHSPTDHIDNLTGRKIMDLVHEIKNGQFEYQRHDENGYKDYFAITRMSSEYDAHIILSMEKKDITNRFGQSAGIYVQMLLVMLASACIWTIFRFRRILKQGDGKRPGPTKEKNSIF